MRRTNLVWLAESRTNYNDFLFQSIHSRKRIDLCVYYRVGAADHHLFDQAVVPVYSMKYLHKFFDVGLLKAVFFDRSVFFVFAGFQGVNKKILIFLCLMLRRRFACWNDTLPANYFRGVGGAIKSVLFNQVYARSVKVLATGHPAMEIHRKRGCPPEKILNFPFFWDLEINSRLEPESTKFFSEFVERGDLVLLLSGRLTEEKNYRTAVEMARKVVEAIGSRRVKFLLAGDGPEKSHLSQLIAAYDLQEVFHLVGWLNGKLEDDFFKMGDVFLHFALFDPFPTVVLRAMVYGLPVIGFEGAGSVKDRIVNGVNGFVIKEGDEAGYFQKLMFFIKNKRAIRAFGREARMTAERWPVNKGIRSLERFVLSKGEIQEDTLK